MVTIINSPKVNPLDKIKLSLIFALRYEDDPYVPSIKSLIEGNNMKEYADYFNIMMDFAGKSRRQCDFLSNKDFFAKTQNKMMQVFKSCPNVFTQHQSFLATLVKDILARKNNSDIVTLNPTNKDK